MSVSPPSGPGLPESRQTLAESIRGFMPPEEGRALYEAGHRAGARGPMLEIGSYCGKSALYLGTAAEQRATILFSVDHHRGSEENQPGWEHHDPTVVDEKTGRIDTLPYFRTNLHEAGLEGTVVPVVGDSPTVARHWEASLALVFIDGGHGRKPAHDDYESWAPKVTRGGLLAIHDVFEDPEEGGRPPFEVFRRAVDSGAFEPRSKTGSLRVLERTGAGC